VKTRVFPRLSLPSVSGEEWVDHLRKVYVEGETAYIPVKDGYPYDCEIDERKPYSGKGYQKMGDTIIFHGETLNENDLNEVLAFERPACVLLSKGQKGVMRIPDIEVFYGTPHDVTFREAGISYTLNPAKVMFSQGNREEKMRIRQLIKPGEIVADMFAGIGYFTLSAAVSGASVHAMELNPESYGYLVRNVQDNNLKDKVIAECGDCRNLLSGMYDRILMGHFDAPDFLPVALEHAGAGTVLHVHGLGDRKEEVQSALSSAGFRYTLNEYKVKKYASHVWHYVWDVTLE